MKHHTPEWDYQTAASTYLIERWGDGYFDVNDRGQVTVSPRQDQFRLPLVDIITAARTQNIQPPFLIRFQDLLRHRVARINSAFTEAMAQTGYQGAYRGVYPIKVNQLREVAEEIIDAGRPFHYGLEVGSKPELMIALAMQEDNESLLVCNGYKDPAFIRLALTGRKLGKNVIMVLEKIEEIHSILEIAAQMHVQPLIGLRLRLQTKGVGKWALSGGESAKFGLSTAEVLEAAHTLRAHHLADSLQLIHFHVGSQISDIGTVSAAVREAARYYAKLHQMGFQLRYLDIGGGLGVDYDGSRTSSDSSINYNLAEYTRAAVATLQETCDEEKVPHPDIVSESGRALVAHHSVLVVEAFASIEKTRGDCPAPAPGAHKLVHDLHQLHLKLNKRNRRETLHMARQIKEDAATRFNLGLLGLEDRAAVETGYWHIAERVVSLFHGIAAPPAEIAELAAQLGDQFLVNFSVFQSLIDYWAVGQLFPIIPLHRLNESPAHQAILVDITCDSDGKIDRFVGEGSARRSLPLHALNGQPYWLGMFLMGAYQDVMGDIHNLFGPVPEVHVFLDSDEEQGYYIEEIIPGHSISEVLGEVQYDPRLLLRQFKQQIDTAIKNDRVKPNDGMDLLRNYEATLGQSTYLRMSPGESPANGTPNGTPLPSTAA